MHKKQKIRRLSKNDKAGDVKSSAVAVGAKMAANANAIIAAQGGIVNGKAGTLSTSITSKATKDAEAKAATTTLHTDNDNAVDAYNAAATIVEQQMPDDIAGWEAMEFHVTEGEVGPVGLCGAIIDCSAVQSAFPGKANIHFHPDPKADYYKVFETTGDPADEAAYYPANPPTFDPAHGTVSPKTLRVTTYWKIVGHNTTGDGPPSVPFGKIIN